MEKEQEEAIKYFKNFTKYTKQLAKDEESVHGKTIYQKDLEKRTKHFETVLSMLKENSAEIEQKNTELAEKNEEIEKLNRQIDLMAEQLAGLTIWDNEKEEPLILTDKEEVKQYIERKVTNNG